jgi:cystathionine beta-synthase
MAVQMIEDAEKEGILKPGGTIIEGTSGNTGLGLAIAAIVKGYKLICTMPDKQSKEKMDILRAVGAEVVVTPTNVTPEDPRSYYSVARRLSKEIPNSFYPNQYDNLSNTKAHYLTTGPEIWEQTDGKITHLVVGVGTGGTICGTGKYLKEKNPNIKIWGIDTYGSVFKKYHETGIFDEKEIYSYLTEGIGEDILPANVDFKIIDRFEKVTDKDGMLMTRRIAREEGIFVGNSAGSAVAGLNQLKNELKPDDLVVVIFHDHGSRYVGKIFNDDWMKERGMLDRGDKTTAYDILKKVNQQQLVSIAPETSITEAISIITGSDVSQLPVIQDSEIVGSVSEHQLFAKLVENPELKNGMVKDIMQTAFPIVNAEASLEDISSYLKSNAAVLVKDSYGKLKIITRHDVIKALAD